MNSYRSVQHGYVVIGIFMSLIVFMPIAYFLKLGSNPIPLPAMLIMTGLFVTLLMFFYKLTLIVNSEGIKIIYGIGLIRKTIKPDLIKGVRTTSVPWYYGMGIRLTPKGMMYNINGFNVVELKYQIGESDKTVLIGTHRGEELVNALKSHPIAGN